MPRMLAAVDGGASKTRATLVAPDGSMSGAGRAGPSSLALGLRSGTSDRVFACAVTTGGCSILDAGEIALPALGRAKAAVSRLSAPGGAEFGPCFVAGRDEAQSSLTTPNK